MKIVSSRREFLTQMSLAVMLPRGLSVRAIQTATSKVEANLGPDQLQVLAAAMDEIIPKGDGMPSATDAGGLEYSRSASHGPASAQRECCSWIRERDGRRSCIYSVGEERGVRLRS